MNNLNIISPLSSVVITDEKLRQDFSRMKPFASPGPDGIPAKCFKNGGNIINDALNDIHNQSRSLT